MQILTFDEAMEIARGLIWPSVLFMSWTDSMPFQGQSRSVILRVYSLECTKEERV